MARVLQILSPRGGMARGPYAAMLAVIAVFAAVMARWGDLDQGFGYVRLALFALLAWTFFVALIKRLADAGFSRVWIVAPLALGVGAFGLGFALFSPSSLIDAMNDTQKTLAVITMLPLFISALGQFFEKIAMGLMWMAGVWGLFALALIIPGTQARD